MQLLASDDPVSQEYTQIFASGGSRSDGTNGDNSPSGAAMLSYDAMRVLFQASQAAFTSKKTPLAGQDLQKALKKGLLTGQDLQQALTAISGSQAFQGVSGQIAFGQDGDPQNKAVAILNVDKQGKAHILGTDGKFLLS
jgi:ABC-type branched-subunit amino acid transport system substrate-binding protein